MGFCFIRVSKPFQLRHIRFVASRSEFPCDPFLFYLKMVQDGITFDGLIAAFEAKANGHDLEIFFGVHGITLQTFVEKEGMIVSRQRQKDLFAIGDQEENIIVLFDAG